MAARLDRRGPAYDVRPAGEYYHAGPFGGVIGAVKDVCQGACSGFLGLLGAKHMTSTPEGFTALESNIGMIDVVWKSLSTNGLAGPIELLGGLVLFFAARRTLARTLGLVGFIAFIAAYAHGYTLSDMIAALSVLLEKAAHVLQTLQASEAGL
ncbi:MAG: hypothetical protein ACX939_08700 [Hyphococcus sp.]